MKKKMAKNAGASADKNPCAACPAICCRYVATCIDTPTTKGDFDDIRWYIAHRDIWVFVDDGDWYLCIERACRYLAKDNRCTIYDHRPRICRHHKIDDCERYGTGQGYDLKFERPEEIETYATEYFRRKRAKQRARVRRLRPR